MNRRDLLRRASIMLGGAVSASVARGILAAERQSRVAVKPLFDPGQRKQVAAIAELILPQTDTPGAIAAGVPDFIEMMVADWYTDTERRIFLKGLGELDGWCQDNHGAAFSTCNPQQQTDALLAAESAASSYEGSGNGPGGFISEDIDENIPFFPKVKELTVTGYYTSEVGAKQELSYNPMPMRYDGEFPFVDVGRQWSS